MEFFISPQELTIFLGNTDVNYRKFYIRWILQIFHLITFLLIARLSGQFSKGAPSGPLVFHRGAQGVADGKKVREACTPTYNPSNSLTSGNYTRLALRSRLFCKIVLEKYVLLKA